MQPMRQFSRRARVLRTGLCCLILLTGGPTATSAGDASGNGASQPELLWPISVNIPMDIAHMIQQEDQAKVILRIGVDGSVIDWVSLDLPHYRLAKPIGQALASARFTPSMQDGEPVIFDMTAVIPVGQVGYYGIISTNIMGHTEGRIAMLGGRSFPLFLCPVDELDEPLELVQQGQPFFFRDETGDVVRGTISVEFHVDQAGVPRIVRPDQEADRRLQEAALRTVEQFRFKRPTRHGRPTVIKARMDLQF